MSSDEASEASEPPLWQDSDEDVGGGQDSNVELYAIVDELDFRKATKKDEDALQSTISDNSRRLISKGNAENVKRAVAALQKQICHKGFLRRGTPAAEMAICVVDLLSEITEKRVPREECTKIMFEFLLACISTGPSSAHADEIIQKIMDMKGMTSYIKKLTGPELTRLLDTIKAVEFTSERPTIKIDDQATYWGDCMLHSLVSNIVNREAKKRLNDPVVHAEMVELHTSFIRMMGDFPKAFAGDIKRVLRGIKNGYDEDGSNMLEVVKKGKDKKKKSLRSKEIVQRQFEGLKKVVYSEKFGRNKVQLETTVEEIERTLGAIRDTPDITEFWDSILQFMKELALSEKCAQYPEIINPLRIFFGNLEEKRFKKNPELVTKWIPVFGEMLQKAPSYKCLESWAFTTATRMADYWVPQEDLVVSWLVIVKGLVRFLHKAAGRAAHIILNRDKFKAIWDWKKNESHAVEIIKTIGKIDFPTEQSMKEDKKKKRKAKDSDDSDDSDSSSDEEEVKLHDEIWDDFAECIDTLMNQFALHKIDDKLGPTVAELTIATMEKRSAFLNRFAKHVSDNLNLKNYPSVVPGLMERMVVLLKERDYPWEATRSVRVGRILFDGSLNAYKEGKDIPATVNKAFITAFKFTMETEGLSFLYGAQLDKSIYFEIVHYVLRDFVDKHIYSTSHQVCAVLVPGLIKQRRHKIEELQETAMSILENIGNNKPSLLSKHVDVFIKWYTGSRDETTLGIIDKTYKVCRALKKEEFRDLLKALFDDDTPDTKELQSNLILRMSVKQPECFTQKDIDSMIAKYVNDEDTQYNALASFSKIMMKNPDIFGENMMKDVLKNRKVKVEYSVDLVGITLAGQKKTMVQPILKEFMEMSKRCHDSMDQVTAINGARSIAVMHGMDLIKPYRPYFEDLQKKGSDVMLRDMAKMMLNAIDGENVNAIKDEFKQKIEVLDDLVVQVAETREEVAEVKTAVKKQEKEIKSVKTDVKTVKKDVKVVQKDLKETQIKVEEVDNKTMTNAPKWSRDLTKLMNPKTEHDWRLLAQRLGYTPQDIKGWATQHDPCMGLLSEWYATHKTIEATHAILNILQEMNRMDAAAIVENAMKAVEDVVEEEVDYATPPPIFLSYQWGHQNEVKLLRNHLLMAGYECWMDIGQMGGGDKLFEKIDNGIRGAKVIICCVSEKYAKSPNCNREVNLSVNLGKPMIPLLMEKMAWPPKGSMGPIFSEYLFVRFFQRGGEETEDQRYWPVPKFQELLMQLNMYKAMPDESIMSSEYKQWWVPVTEEIVITKKKDGVQNSQVQPTTAKGEDSSPDVFLSYQWGKQRQIKQLYRRLNELGYSCWMDIYQMGGGDSLYDKIDKGVRGCKVVLSCVTTKYAMSANCRREVSLADSLKKPLVPLLLEKIDWPPAGPMSMVFTQLLFINFYRDETTQLTWVGDKFDELHTKIRECIPSLAIDDSDNKDHTHVKTLPKDKSPEKETTKSLVKSESNTKAADQKPDAGSPKVQPKSPKTSPSKEESGKDSNMERSSKNNNSPENQSGNEVRNNRQSEDQPKTSSNEEPKPTTEKQKSSACVVL